MKARHRKAGQKIVKFVEEPKGLTPMGDNVVDPRQDNIDVFRPEA